MKYLVRLSLSYSLQEGHIKALNKVCLHNSRKTWILSVMLGERFCDKIFMIALSVCKPFVSALSPHLSPEWSPICPSSFSPYPLPFSAIGISWNRSPQPDRKGLIRFRKFARKSTTTRSWQERSHKWLLTGEIGEPAGDQRNLSAKVSIADITAKVENDQWESAMKLTQAHNVSAKMNLQLSKSRPGERLNCFTRRQSRSDRECARQSQQWLNILTVGESNRGKERAGQPHPQPGGLLEGAGGSMKNGGQWTL